MKVTYTRGEKINTGNYNQSQVDIQVEKEFPQGVSLESAVISLTAEADPLFLGKVEAIKNPNLVALPSQESVPSSHRIREKDGKKYPSVTTIMKPDGIDFDPELLAKYALRGTWIEDFFWHWKEDGIWIDPSEQEELDIFPLKFEDIKYKNFFNLFKDRIEWTKKSTHLELYNDAFMYSGEEDVHECLVDGIKTSADLKTGKWHWGQLLAYWFTHQETDQLAIFDTKQCKLETLDPRSKRAQKHLANFFVLRGEYKQRFGL